MHQFDEFGGFGSRQTDLLINGLAQISARNGLLGHRQPRYTKSISYLKFKGIALYAWGQSTQRRATGKRDRAMTAAPPGDDLGT